MTSTANIPLLDLKAQYATIEADVEHAIQKVLKSQRFIMGPEVEALEEEIAQYSGTRFGIGVSSGTDALLVALMALGVGPGDEVITSVFTFFSTAGVIVRLGARPVFVDIDPNTYNLVSKYVEDAITDRTKAIIPVHLFGQCADMSALSTIAISHNIPIVEDAAQAIGAEHQGRRAGSMGAIGCLSFFPSKNLGGIGDGGMCITNDENLSERLRCLRAHGSKPKYYHSEVGGNFRLDAICAAVLRTKLTHLDDWTAARQKNAALYDHFFEDAAIPTTTLSPPGTSRHRHVYNQYTIAVDRRDALREHLKSSQIGCEVYYPVPLHRQACFADLGYGEGSLPVAEKMAAKVISLPVYPELSEDQIKRVATNVIEFLS